MKKFTFKHEQYAHTFTVEAASLEEAWNLVAFHLEYPEDWVLMPD